MKIETSIASIVRVVCTNSRALYPYTRTLIALTTSDFSNRWPVGDITGCWGADPEMAQNMARAVLCF